MFNPKNISGALQSWEYLPAAAGTYQAGQLVNAVDGKIAALDKASTTTPGYVCMANVTVEDGHTLPVQRIAAGTIYATELTAETAAAKIGSKLQVSADGLGVDGAAAGTFEIVAIEGTEQGAAVSGRFC